MFRQSILNGFEMDWNYMADICKFNLNSFILGQLQMNEVKQPITMIKLTEFPPVIYSSSFVSYIIQVNILIKIFF